MNENTTTAIMGLMAGDTFTVPGDKRWNNQRATARKVTSYAGLTSVEFEVDGMRTQKAFPSLTTVTVF